MSSLLSGLLLAIPVTVVFAAVTPDRPWWTTILVAFAASQVGAMLDQAANRERR